MIPITRIEKFLNGIIYGSSVPEPITRIEVMLNDIKNGDVVSLTPITREEIYLAKISGANVEIPTPITREEMYLAKIAGLTIETPSPIVRIEHWLNDWAGGSDPLNTFTGAIVRFFSRFAKPIVKLEANFTPIQDLNGQEAPYPPGGGKNKLPYPYFFTTEAKNGCTATVAADGTVSFSGTPSADSTWNVKRRTDTSGDGSLFLPEGEYILNGCPSGGGTSTYRILLINADGTSGGKDDGSGLSFTVPSGGAYYGIQLYIASGYNPNSLVFKPMIRLSSVSDATFAPYSNICPISGHTGCDIIDKAEYDPQATPTVSISFGQTVYGCKLTVFEDGSGQAVANMAAVDMGSLNWQYDSEATNKNFWAYGFADVVPPPTNGDKANVLTDMFVTSTANAGYAGTAKECIAVGTTSRVYVYTELYTSKSDFKTAVTGQKLVYETKNPITIPLTPGQIQTLVGENVVFVNDADGDITVQAYGTQVS